MPKHFDPSDPFTPFQISRDVRESYSNMMTAPTEALYIESRNEIVLLDDYQFDCTKTEWFKKLEEARQPFITAAKTVDYTAGEAEGALESLREVFGEIARVVCQMPTAASSGTKRVIVPDGGTRKAADGFQWFNSFGIEASEWLDEHSRRWAKAERGVKLIADRIVKAGREKSPGRPLADWGKVIYPRLVELRTPRDGWIVPKWPVTTNQINKEFHTKYKPDDLKVQFSKEKKKRRDKGLA
jgi:hypothetical protein